MNIEVSAVEELKRAALDLLEEFRHQRIFVFIGKMGAGKTTFIQHVCTELGVAEQMSSPTFSIVNEYLGKNSTSIFHFDLYRLEREEEALDLGFEEYLDSENYCFIEWPDKASSFLPDQFVIVRIEEQNGRRIISANIN